MPKLGSIVIRRWLDKHNWSVNRLARECSTIGEDTVSPGTLRNVISGRDPMRSGRIHLIATVTAKYGDGLTYDDLAVPDTTRPTT